MDINLQTKAFQLIEQLLSNGHDMSTLPIDTAHVKGIISLKENATKQDVALLERAQVTAGDN